MEVNDVLTFSYTSAVQTQTLPAGTFKLECWGAQGKRGSNATAQGGLGGYVCGEITLTENTTLNIYVGGGKVSENEDSSGGWNGGGNGHHGGGGGGGSDIRIGGTSLTNRVIVGAGGGGCGNSMSTNGGYGGGLIGGGGGSYSVTNATQTAGGDRFGTLGVGGSDSDYNGGGGGGGYYGGGCAGNYSQAIGSGGSSYYGDLANPSTISGQKTGHGEIKITMLSGGGTTPTVSRRFAQIM